MLYSFIAPDPDPDVTIFYLRLLLVQDYELVSPRRPNDPPHRPESTMEQILFRGGKRPSQGVKTPSKEGALYRGDAAAGSSSGEHEGFKSKSLVRLPGHDLIRPSTPKG